MKIIKISKNTYSNIQDIFSITKDGKPVANKETLRQVLLSSIFSIRDTIIVYSNDLKDIPFQNYSHTLAEILPGYIFHFNEIFSHKFKAEVESRAFTFDTMESLNNFLDRMLEKGVVVHEVYTTLRYSDTELIVQKLDELIKLNTKTAQNYPG